MVQLGVMRRSDEINGGADGVSPGTVICSGMSWAVSNDMVAMVLLARKGSLFVWNFEVGQNWYRWMY
jgi:hypothetical protein